MISVASATVFLTLFLVTYSRSCYSSSVTWTEHARLFYCKAAVQHLHATSSLLSSLARHAPGLFNAPTNDVTSPYSSVSDTSGAETWWGKIGKADFAVLVHRRLQIQAVGVRLPASTSPARPFAFRATTTLEVGGSMTRSRLTRLSSLTEALPCLTPHSPD